MRKGDVPVKIFLSWSGQRSHKAACVLREWLPSVIQSVAPYVSSEDIDKGARWSTDIAKELEAAHYGIICITKENVATPWINFEAGALSKSLDKSNVTPFLLDKDRQENNFSDLQCNLLECCLTGNQEATKERECWNDRICGGC